MKPLVLLALSFTSIACLTGCIIPNASNELVPKTVIDWNPKTGEFHAELPKDHSLAGGNLSRQTNGCLDLSLTNLNSKTNPDVIGAAGSAQAEAIKASAEMYKANMQFLTEAIKLIAPAAKSVAPIPVP